jgi:beta-lactam-binding protein with PASTA domain
VATPLVRCVVPKLAGETLALARTAISHAHCSVGHITRSPSARVAKGRVSAESPRPGSKLRKGSKIDFTLSTGKAKGR